MDVEMKIKPSFEIDMNCDGGIPRIYLDGNHHFWVKVSTCRHEKGIDKQLEKNAEWVCAALNEKAERDFTEQMQWIIEGDGFNISPYLVCPKCKMEPGLIWDGESIEELSVFEYCPRCGKHLSPRG
jgi:hypothetical protein